MFAPIIFPIESELSCRFMAQMVVISSGREVPTAKTVVDIMASLIPSRNPKTDALSTKSSAPKIMPSAPTVRRITDNIIPSPSAIEL